MKAAAKQVTMEEIGQIETPMAKMAIIHANDDSLFQELELRYGGVFAQWVIDRI